MDKADVKHEAQSDTSSVINMKEYAPSEYPSSEPPPAYMKSRPNSLRIARLAAFTVLASAVILGAFILAASWIQANTARNLDLTLNQELMDELQHPTYEHLVANDLLQEQQDNMLAQEVPQEKKQEQPQQAEPQENQRGQEEQDTRQQMATSQEGGSSLELDAIANVLMQKGMRGNVNCIVEKRRNEELVDHAPRALNLPGLNITTPPRLQHLTGEQVVIICKDDSSEEKDDVKEDEQPMMLPLPPQFAQQMQQQVPQMIPLAQILQQIQAQQQQQQQQIFVPQQQPQQEQQIFFQPQPQQVYQQPQQLYHSQLPVQHIFYPQLNQQQQRPVFVPQQMVYRQQPQFPVQSPQQEQQAPEQQPPMPLHPVPLSQLMGQRTINPMAIQDVPMNQMPITHMPMRDARMPEQPIPVHHLVPPRPQQVRIENFSQDEDEFPRDLPAIIRQRIMQREREMPRNVMTEALPRPLPLEAREPRIMRGPGFPINDNRLQEEIQQPMSPRFPPSRRFRFPESSEQEGMAITRIIPIRLDKETEEEPTSSEEKRLPIPLNAILDMVFRGIRPLVGRQPFPVPIDIKIERIVKPMSENMPESEESQEQEDSQSQEDGAEGQEETESNDEKPEDASDAKVQQVEIVEKDGENTQAIPIPADAQDAQIFKLEDKPEGEWVGRAFLPNGQGRGGVFQIPQGLREAQIFTVSDARAGVPMSASFEATSTKEDEEVENSKESSVLSIGQPEGEVNLFPVPMNVEQSVKLYPVEEINEKVEQDQKVDRPQQMEEAESATHIVQPRSV